MAGRRPKQHEIQCTLEYTKVTGELSVSSNTWTNECWMCWMNNLKTTVIDLVLLNKQHMPSNKLWKVIKNKNSRGSRVSNPRPRGLQVGIVLISQSGSQQSCFEQLVKHVCRAVIGCYTSWILITSQSSGPRCLKSGTDWYKGTITSKIKHAIKLKTSPARLAQLLQPPLAFCFTLQPMTAHRPVRRHSLAAS